MEQSVHQIGRLAGWLAGWRGACLNTSTVLNRCHHGTGDPQCIASRSRFARLFEGNGTIDTMIKTPLNIAAAGDQTDTGVHHRRTYIDTAVASRSDVNVA